MSITSHASSVIGKNLATYDVESIQSSQEYLEDQLPKIFGVKTDKNQKCMLAGRHPRSLRKVSEMSHYLKLSNERQSRMFKGHSFWNVVNEESLIQKYPTDKDHDKIVAAQDEEDKSYTYEIPSEKEISTVESTKKSDKEYEPLFNSMADLEMRIDFKTKNHINYSNTFIIMNYMDEVLYVNTANELRCKPIRALIPTDRVKFRLLDLNNVSNPASLRYDDPVWLQICDNADTGEISLSNSSLIAAKLVGPPPLKSIQFEIPGEEKKSKLTNNKCKESRQKKSSKESVEVEGEAEGDAEVEQATGGPGRREAKVCGNIDVMRIHEKNKADSAGDTGGTPSFRYASKQAGHLGKWVVHSAKRVDNRHGQEDKEDDHVMSASPIYIQQDLYCIGTTKSRKFSDWPRTKPTTQPRTRMNEDYEKLKLEDSYEYGCVRKVAERGFPYDFNIDRKCVWKFCLFEQFTGSATSAQDKERTSQRIMQEATMRLKLSRLAREGGRTYLSENAALPALKGGQDFSKILRHIVNRETQSKEAETLVERRSKEAQIIEYFTGCIRDQVIDEEAELGDDTSTLKSSVNNKNIHNIFGAAGSAENSKDFLRDLHNSGVLSLPGNTLTMSTADDDSSIDTTSTAGTSQSNLNPLTFPLNKIGMPGKKSNQPYSRMQRAGQNAVNSRVSLQQFVAGNTANTGVFNAKGTTTDESNNATKQPKAVLSEEIQKVFCNPGQKLLESKHFLLNHKDAMQNYDNLSGGEKVVALHRTFNHLYRKHDFANHQEDPQDHELHPNLKRIGSRGHLNDQVLLKLAKLREEDIEVQRVLGYKDRLDKESDLSAYVNAIESDDQAPS